MASVVYKALRICMSAHSGSFGKDGKPYWEHPVWVADHVQGEEYVATALLHDVLEDTKITTEDLRGAGIPEQVVNAVLVLTKFPEQRYEDYITDVLKDPIATEVKKWDLIHNMDLSRLLYVDLWAATRQVHYANALKRLMTEGIKYRVE